MMDVGDAGFVLIRARSIPFFFGNEFPPKDAHRKLHGTEKTKCTMSPRALDVEVGKSAEYIVHVWGENV